LGLILDGEHLPHLPLLNIIWIDDDTLNIHLWITTNTPLR
ncbi:unnamed protein product, partial [Rotaria sordida]